MIGRKFTGHLLLFLCCYCLTSAAKETITCDAPSVRDGQPATVTCDFKRNVSALGSATVTVEHYPHGSPNPTPVLECTPVGADCKLPVPGYEFNNQINTKLVLTITSASMENSGRFACKMLSPDLAEADEVEPCDFTLVVGSTSTTTSTTPSPTTSPLPGGIDIALIVGPTVAGIVIVAVAIIIVCIIKKRRDRRKDQTEEELLKQSELTPQKKHTDGEKGPPTKVTPKRKALIPPNKNKESLPQTQASEETKDDEREPQDSPSDRLLDNKKIISQQETESLPQTQASEERKDDEREPQDSHSDRLLDNKKTTSQQETFGISPAEAGTMTSADERDQENSPAPAGLGEQDSRANDDDGEEPGKQPVEVSDEQSQTARGGEGSNEKITPVEDKEGGVDTSQLPPFEKRKATFEQN